METSGSEYLNFCYRQQKGRILKNLYVLGPKSKISKQFSVTFQAQFKLFIMHAKLVQLLLAKTI